MYSVQAVRKAEEGPQFLKVPSSIDMVKVATTNNMAPLSRLLFVLKAGSRYEDGSNYGVTHLMRHTAYLGTEEISAFKVFKELEKLGTRFNAVTTRDYTMYSLTCTRNNLPNAFKVVYPLMEDREFNKWEWRDSNHNAKMQFDVTALQNQPEVLLMEGIHEAAYRHGLGNSLFASPNLIGKISQETATCFIAKTCRLDRMGVACAGIDSDVLTDLLEEAISPVSRDEEYDSEEIAFFQKEVFDRVKTMHGVNQNVAVKDLLKMCGTEIDLVKKKIAKYGISEDQTIESAVVKDVFKFYDIARTVTNDEKAKYFGGERRINRGDFPLTYVTFATEGPSMSSADRLSAALVQQVLNPSTSVKYVANVKGSRLSSAVKKVTDGEFMVKGLNVNYSDSGLFGFTVAADPQDIGKVSKAALDEFLSLASTSITDADVAKAKYQLKSDIAMKMENVGATVMNLAEQVHVTQNVTSLNDTLMMVDAIKTDDVVKVAKKLAGGKLSMSSVGNLKNVPYLDQFTK